MIHATSSYVPGFGNPFSLAVEDYLTLKADSPAIFSIASYASRRLTGSLKKAMKWMKPRRKSNSRRLKTQYPTGGMPRLLYARAFFVGQ